MPLRSCRRAAWLLCIAAALPVRAQTPPDPRLLMDPQREAMAALRPMLGVWRGPAWTLLADGTKHEIVQTERIGPFLDGTLTVIEGRGHEPGGRISFNALGIVSYNVQTRKYSMRSYAQGRAGDFLFEPNADGYRWEIPAGPATIRFAATIRDGTLHETGERVVPGQPPVQFFEMNLKRVGDTDWPLAGAIGPN